MACLDSSGSSAIHSGGLRGFRGFLSEAPFGRPLALGLGGGITAGVGGSGVLGTTVLGTIVLGTTVLGTTSFASSALGCVKGTSRTSLIYY